MGQPARRPPTSDLITITSAANTRLAQLGHDPTATRLEKPPHTCCIKPAPSPPHDNTGAANRHTNQINRNYSRRRCITKPNLQQTGVTIEKQQQKDYVLGRATPTSTCQHDFLPIHKRKRSVHHKQGHAQGINLLVTAKLIQ